MLKKKELIDQEFLRSILLYEASTGVFRWKKTSRHYKEGQVAGTLHKFGYVIISIDNAKYRAHRLAWLYVYGKWPEQEIDHINKSRSDNRIDNLRECDRLQNMQNADTLSARNKSGFIGVARHKSGKWRAQIQLKRKQYYLGLFDTVEDAKNAYLIAKSKLHPFSAINI